MDSQSSLEVVWLTEERTYAYLIQSWAYYALVRYTREGIDYEVFVDADDFEYINEGDDSDED